jgi:hypothetical protein
MNDGMEGLQKYLDEVTDVLEKGGFRLAVISAGLAVNDPKTLVVHQAVITELGPPRPPAEEGPELERLISATTKEEEEDAKNGSQRTRGRR